MPNSAATPLPWSLRISKSIALLLIVRSELSGVCGEIAAGGADLGQKALVGLQFEVAVRAPDPAIEGDDNRSAPEIVPERYGLPACVRQRERRREAAFAQRPLQDPARADVFDRTLDVGDQLRWHPAGCVGDKGFDLLLQGHGFCSFAAS